MIAWFKKKHPSPYVRTPLILQMETVDCGATALAIILAYYQCDLPLELIRKRCLVSRDGVSIATLAKAASSFGLDIRVYEHIPLDSLTYPLILFWNRKHYVVLEGIKNKKFYINDPQVGKYILDEHFFYEKFSNRVIQLRPNEQFKKSNISLLRTELYPLIKKKWYSVLSLGIGLSILSFFQFSPIIFTKLFIDQYFNKSFIHFNNLLALMLGVVLVQFLLSYITRKSFRFLENYFAKELNYGLIAQLVQLPLTFFHFRRSTDLLNRLQSADRLVADPWTAVCSLLTALVQGSFALLFLFSYSAWFAGMTLSVSVIAFALLSFYQKSDGPLQRHLNNYFRQLSSLTAHYITQRFQIKTQFAEHRFWSKWVEELNGYLKKYRQSVRKKNRLHFCILLLCSLSYFSLLSWGVFLVSTHQLSLGELLACQMMLLSFNEALVQKNKLLASMVQIEMELHNMVDINHYVHDNEKKAQPVASDLTPTYFNRVVPTHFANAIVLNKITFGYSYEFKPLFDELDLTITKDSYSSLIGDSGCGKSTLAHLLLGLYKPWSGEILLNGVSIEEYSLEERAQLVGVVNQQQFFFQGSIRDNLCFWREGYNDEALKIALKLACIEELIDQNDEGLDFKLTEGATNLSGGQRQRLELARTLLAKPKILLLDEISSSLDPLVEARIKKNLKQYQATKLIITNRHYACSGIDLVYRLEKGKIIKEQFTNALATPFPCVETP